MRNTNSITVNTNWLLTFQDTYYNNLIIFEIIFCHYFKNAG